MRALIIKNFCDIKETLSEYAAAFSTLAKWHAVFARGRSSCYDLHHNVQDDCMRGDLGHPLRPTVTVVWDAQTEPEPHTDGYTCMDACLIVGATLSIYQHSGQSAHVADLSPIANLSVCLSGKCTVAKRLIGSGYRLGW